MNTPEISVIIPLYNKEKIIERSVHSVLNQSFQDFELIIVNDGSTDNSWEIVRSIHDERIVLVEQENGGPSKARNTGAKCAKGDWIVFLDADDELRPDALEYFIKIKNNNKDIELFCCEFIVRGGSQTNQQYTYNNTIVNNGYKSWLLNKSCPRTGATMYSKRLVLKCPFNGQIRRFEDLECLFRMFGHTRIFIGHHVVLTINTEYAAASSSRKNIKEDFVGHLDFKGKSFWEQMALYKFYLGERDYYPEQIRELYPNLHRRYDLMLLLMIVKKLYK